MSNLSGLFWVVMLLSMDALIADFICSGSSGQALINCSSSRCFCNILLKLKPKQLLLILSFSHLSFATLPWRDKFFKVFLLPMNPTLCGYISPISFSLICS